MPRTGPGVVPKTKLQPTPVTGLYAAARDACHAYGFPWYDPRTGDRHDPPEHAQLGAILTVVNLLLEDVAEEPLRLKRAQELAKRDIAPLLDPSGPLSGARAPKPVRRRAGRRKRGGRRS